MSYSVTGADIQAFETDGVVCLRKVIAPERAAEMLRATYDFIDQGPESAKTNITENGGRYFTGNTMSRTDSVFRDFALKSTLPKVAANLMKTDTVRFFYDQVFLVEPETRKATPWHNDLAHWPFDGEDIVSLWVALTHVDSESSPLEYVAGSHTDKKLYRAAPLRETTANDASTFDVCPNYSDARNQQNQRILSWELEPGDVLAHHPLVLHGAKPNTSRAQLRCGLSLRYLGRDVRYFPRENVTRSRQFAATPGQYPADDVNLPLIRVN